MNEQDRRELGAAIRRQRKAMKLTQGALAAAAGVSTRTIVSIEKGEHSTQPGNTDAVMRILGLDVEPTVDTESWPADVAVFLDMMGAYLSTLTEQQRLAVIREITASMYRRPPAPDPRQAGAAS